MLAEFASAASAKEEIVAQRQPGKKRNCCLL
jgi:hypothetical protein